MRVNAIAPAVIEFVLDLAGNDGPRTICELMPGDDGVDMARQRSGLGNRKG